MKIVFVCTGNASRSAVAEAILKHMLADRGVEGIDVASCGTDVPDGLEREPVMCRIASAHGYAMGGKAIAITDTLLNSADVIIVMTAQHREEVKRLLAIDSHARIVRFNDYCFGDPSDLPDPHYHSEEVYRQCFAIIERGCREILKKFG